MNNSISVVILTFNEEKHIQRCIDSAKQITKKIYVIDSLSTDRTKEISISNGVFFYENKFVNHAAQFNWALDNIEINTPWVFRLDADEVISNELISEINSNLALVSSDCNGINICRKINFLGENVRFGGVGRVNVLRIFRYGFGRCENRWMDEHIKVDGNIKKMNGSIIDDNLNSLQWWISKHNSYSSKEAIELANIKLKLFDTNSIAAFNLSNKPSFKRWIKENIYVKIPISIRARMYFIVRFVFLLGFLDKKSARKFHYLQALWYRNLVDMKVTELIELLKHNKELKPEHAIMQLFNIDIREDTS